MPTYNYTENGEKKRSFPQFRGKRSWVAIFGVCFFLLLVIVIIIAVSVSPEEDPQRPSPHPSKVTAKPSEQEQPVIPIQHGERMTIELNGEWTISNSSGFQVPGTVPGTVHTALIAAKVIGDPYYRFNDLEYRWVHRTDWTYSRTFQVSKEVTSRSSILLVCDGLDTVASVYINNKKVGESVNQFVQYIFDIKDVVKVGANSISVEFKSAVQYALDQYNKHAYPIVPKCPPPDQNPECHANMVRKNQASFGWDWAPAFPTQGISRNISIKAFNSSTIQQISAVAVRQNKGPPETWALNVTVIFDINDKIPVEGNLTLTLSTGPNSISFQPVAFKHVTVKLNHSVCECHTTLENLNWVRTWWPRGYGYQNLYTLKVTFSNERDISTKSTKVGFRTVQLVQEDMINGMSFYFKINDLPIFQRGSNWVPADAFQDRVTLDKYRNLLQTAVDSNQNTIRVWGGGIYEEDVFYELADEMGIMIWQDLMFATAMYPADKAFLDTVKKEVKYQIRRLRSHPSIIAWAANNENEYALADNRFNTTSRFDQYKRDYISLYVHTVRDTVLDLDQSVPFLISSPSNGKKTEENGWVSRSSNQTPNNPRFGDVHHFDWISDCWDHTTFPPARYASEYGYQSLPSFETLEKVSKPVDWSISSNFSVHRQHNTQAGEGMHAQIIRHFDLPSSNNSLKNFKDYIYLSQVSQALCYKFQTEWYRRGMGVQSMKTMGALYWQLNCIWPSPSWSSTEYGGKWKMLQYYISKSFSDPIASVYEENGRLYMWGVSDLTFDLKDVTLSVEVWRWAAGYNGTDMKPYSAKNISTRSIPKQSAVEFATQNMSVLLGNLTREECVIKFLLTNPDGKANSPVSVFYPTSLKDAVGMRLPNLKIGNITATPEGAYTVPLTTDAVAVFTWLEVAGVKGRFSNNGFLMTRPNMTVIFYPWEDTSVETLTGAISVTCLQHVYS